VSSDRLIFFDCFSKQAHLRRPGQLIRSTRGADQGSVDRQDHGRESCVSRHARAGPLARRAVPSRVCARTCASKGGQCRRYATQAERHRRQHFPSLDAGARPRARRLGKSKAVAGRQGRKVVDRSADPVCEKCTDTHGCAGRRDSREHQGRTGTHAAGTRIGSIVNCCAALPPIMRAISGSGTLAVRSWANASQALVAS